MIAEPPTPTPLDVLTNLLIGLQPGAASLPPPQGHSVRAALEQAVLPALSRPPCLVSFSGGRDSSAILAVAVAVARQHGLPAPVPAIMRFPASAESLETSWQELVLDHLGLRDKVIITLADELDALGPVATRVLQEHGVRWPGNGYMHVPIFEAARGGSVLTGVGGDELFSTRGSRGVLLRHRRVRPRLRDTVAWALELAPRRVRALEWRLRRAPEHPWLTREGGALIDRALARDAVAWPSGWDASVRYWPRTRGFAGLTRVLPSLAHAWDVRVTSPFVEPAVLAELARIGGPTGFDSRRAAMRELFGDVLPTAMLERESKAGFSGSVFGEATRRFATDWTGSGVDPRYVDVTALRDIWLSPSPNFMTMLLLQSAWLRSSAAPGQPSRSSS
jgi:asparagine synthase (glutamine-hydrolysing)